MRAFDAKHRFFMCENYTREITRDLINSDLRCNLSCNFTSSVCT